MDKVAVAGLLLLGSLIGYTFKPNVYTFNPNKEVVMQKADMMKYKGKWHEYDNLHQVTWDTLSGRKTDVMTGHEIDMLSRDEVGDYMYVDGRLVMMDK